MSKFILFLSVLLLGLQSNQAQESCDCVAVLKKVSEEVETNSASFADQVIVQQNTRSYKKHKRRMTQIAKSMITQKECIGLVKLYLSYLKDEHQNLFLTNDFYPFVSFNDTLKVKNFVKANVENYNINSEIKANGILGNWIHENGTLELQIQDNSNKGRSHIGLLKTSYHYYGNIGDLKVEFYKNQANELIAKYWSFGQNPSIHNVILENNILSIGRHTKLYRNRNDIVDQNSQTLKNTTFFEVLSEHTNYLRIHSFDYENKQHIDSLLEANTSKITSKTNLIIDLRQNGGGSDLSYQKLLPFVMDTIYYKTPTNASVWVSPDNFKIYNTEKYLYGVKTKQDSLNADIKIEKLKPYLGGFTPKKSEVFMVQEAIHNSPKNVYLIIDQKCASSTEGFILTAMQSSKVKTFGENTSGTLSYGDWRTIEIDNFPAILNITTKKMHILNDIKMESIGISPNTKLNSDNKSNWINIILKTIEG